MSRSATRAGRWLVQSGIQEAGGGVARYYRSDTARNHAVSTEITGYAVSAFVYLHTLAREPQYLEAALAAGRFLTGTAWDGAARALPFELDPPRRAYFFDSGIVARGLLSAWRVTGEDEFLETAVAVGESMADAFAAGGGEYHPILELPEKIPAPREECRWSTMPGCYQLKAAMAWHDLAEAGVGDRFSELYGQALDAALRTADGFLSGPQDPLRVMDRLHAFLYFLEGLLPRAGEERYAAVMRRGMTEVARLLREIAPRFERSDVHAQLLRLRLYADWAGAAPLDREAAEWEAGKLAGFQIADSDPRIDGGFCFGRKDGASMPFVNPVSTAFGLQALALWERCRGGVAQPHRHLLI
ncbi:MAG TPA: hypothetical protein VMU19_09820 [Bryobacteraceae bacterium]|nr:hypothetical protein [Bryobacteraceae bacterium]